MNTHYKRTTTTTTNRHYCHFDQNKLLLFFLLTANFWTVVYYWLFLRPNCSWIKQQQFWKEHRVLLKKIWSDATNRIISAVNGSSGYTNHLGEKKRKHWRQLEALKCINTPCSSTHKHIRLHWYSAKAIVWIHTLRWGPVETFLTNPIGK